MGSLFMLLIVWRYTVRFLERKTEAADERRRQEELALDIELERKLKTARKESILCVLPKTVCLLGVYFILLLASGFPMPNLIFILFNSSCPIVFIHVNWERPWMRLCLLESQVLKKVHAPSV